MKSKKIICFYILIALFIFGGCKEANPITHDNYTHTEEVVMHTDDLSPFQEILSYENTPGLLTLHADMFIGNLPESKGQLSLIECTVTANQCSCLGRRYIEVPCSEGFSGIERCGWQLDCSLLEILGISTEGDTVYAAKDQEGNIVTLLLVGATEGKTKVAWYISEQLDVLDIQNYGLEDFRVECIARENSPNTIEEIWEYHRDKSYSDRGAIMSEKPQAYCCFLVNKELPWLVYELNYFYESSSENYLFIYNVPNDDVILIENKSCTQDRERPA